MIDEVYGIVIVRIHKTTPEGDTAIIPDRYRFFTIYFCVIPKPYVSSNIYHSPTCYPDGIVKIEPARPVKYQFSAGTQAVS